MKKRSDKKGLSTIVTTLLILLLIFVAIGIIWVVIKRVITEGTEQVSLGKFTLDLEIKSVTLGTNSVNVKVKRNPGAGEMSGLNFIVDDGDTTKVIEKNGSMSELQERTFILSAEELGSTIIVANIQKIEIAPIFKLESGKEVAGPVKDEYIISTGGGGTTPPPTECSSPEDCDDNNDCTTDTCPSGTCVHSAICISDENCCSGCASDPDCAECSSPEDCGQGSTEDICLSGDVYTRTITWTCPSGTCQQNVNDVLSDDCDDDNDCTTDTCSSAQCFNILECSADGQCCTACSSDPDCEEEPEWMTGLVSWWTFDTDASDSIGSNEGTNHGASHVTSGCQSGGCYDFDGSSDYIDVGTFSVSGDEISIATWVNYEGSTFALDPRIISKAHGTEGSEHVFQVGLNDVSGGLSAEYRWRFTTSTGTTSYETGSVSPNSGWYQIVMVYDGSHGIIYVDGSSIGSEARTGNLITNSDAVNIGRNPVGDVDGYRYWNGKLDEVMIWNRALSPTEVDAIYDYFN